MEYMAMIVLILIVATGYMLVLDKSADHGNGKNNKK